MRRKEIRTSIWDNGKGKRVGHNKYQTKCRMCIQTQTYRESCRMCTTRGLAGGIFFLYCGKNDVGRSSFWALGNQFACHQQRFGLFHFFSPSMYTHGFPLHRACTWDAFWSKDLHEIDRCDAVIVTTERVISSEKRRNFLDGSAKFVFLSPAALSSRRPTLTFSRFLV